MQLSEFIKTMLGFKTAAEAHFKAAAELEGLRATIAKFTTDLETTKAAELALQGQLDIATKRVNELDGQVKSLTEQLSAANGKANAVIASQGLPADQVPAAAVTSPTASGETPFRKYQRLLGENPKTAGEYWAGHAEEILNSRNG
jgi:hypothetical protein